MAGPPAKAADAFRTIGELSRETGIAQHVLRYWETRFPELRPLQRAGGRRYYRAADAALVRRIHALLSQEGYSLRGAAAVVAQEAGGPPAPPPVAAPPPPVARLRAIRDALAAALDDR